jgi:shikimate dehydrogenase
MMIDGATKPYAVIGHPVRHSLSPLMHNCAFRELGINGVYLALDVLPERLGVVLPGLRDAGFGGVNLTLPHKCLACDLVDELDESARLVGAANTLVFREGKMVGHNTDGWGFLRSLEEEFGREILRQRVCVLGAGGAGRAVAISLAQAGIKHLSVVNRSVEKAEQVVREVAEILPSVEAEAVPLSGVGGAVAEAGLIIQATSSGIGHDDEPLVRADAFHAGQCVYDLIYMYPETGIMREARRAGARVANGLGMLLYQGVRAFELWTGQRPAVESVREVLEKAVYE